MVFSAVRVFYDHRVQLLEREHPLEVLVDRAHRAAAGQGGVVLVTGEAGIGKTALLRTFIERVRAHAPPLWGMCDSLSTPRPLGPLRDIAHELDPTLPELLRGTAAQHEIFAAALDALRTRPRVYVIEDLHWADEATLDLVRFLARRITTLPLLLVLSYRDTLTPDHPLSPVLGDLVTTPDAHRLQLTPLSRSAVAALLDGHGPDPADVHRRTAGNPFYVSQILAQPDSPLPASVRDAVLARIAGLAPSARHALELLSCTPEPVTRELLTALDISITTTGVLAATGLIDRHRRGIAFRHEIARSAILDATPPGTEPALHAAMIDALETVGAEPSVLAHHATAAHDTPRVLRYAPAAAAQASRSGAHREAVAFYDTALRHLGDDTATDAAMRAALLEAMSLDLYLTDRLRDAIAAREQALVLRRELGEVVAVGAAHTALAGFAWYAADRALAERHARAAIEILSVGRRPARPGLRPVPGRLPRGLARRHPGRPPVGRPGGPDRRRAGRRRRAAQHRVRRGRSGPPARRRPGRAGRPARDPRRRAATPARRPGDDADEQPLPLRRRAGTFRRCGGVGRSCPADQRGARHPDLHRVPARSTGAAAAAAGALGRGRERRPHRAPGR